MIIESVKTNVRNRGTQYDYKLQQRKRFQSVLEERFLEVEKTLVNYFSSSALKSYHTDISINPIELSNEQEDRSDVFRPHFPQLT